MVGIFGNKYKTSGVRKLSLEQRRRTKDIAYAVSLITLSTCLISPALAYTGNYAVADLVFALSCMLGLMELIIFRGVWIELSRKDGLQLAGCTLPLLLFIPLVCVYAEGQDAEFVLRATLLYAVAFAFWLFWVLVALKDKGNNRAGKLAHRLSGWVRDNWMVLVLIVLLICLCYEDLHRGVKWDSGHYYKGLIGVDQLSFSSSDILQLKKAGHLSYSFSFFYGIGYMLLPQNHVLGVRIVTVLFYVASVAAFYSIILRTFRLSKLQATLISAVFGLTPSVLGPIHEINLEPLSLAVFTLMVWAYLSEMRLLQMVLSIAFVFIKENNALFLFMFCIGDIAVCLLNCARANSGKKSLRKLIAETSNSNLVRIIAIYYVPCIAFLAHYVLNASAWGANATGSGNLQVDYLNSFGLNKVNVLSKIYQIFFMNFNWAICLVILLCFSAAFVARAKMGNRRSRPRVCVEPRCEVGAAQTSVPSTRGQGVVVGTALFLPMAAVWVGFIAFSFFYITYVFPRYTVLSSFFLSFALAAAVSLPQIKTLIKNLLIACLSALLLVENFITVDPVTKALFRQIDTGESTIVTMSNIIAYSANNYIVETASYRTDAMALSPYAYYNRQWGYFDDLMDKLLQAIGYREGDLLVFPDYFSPISVGPFMGWCSDSYFDSDSGHIYQQYGDDRDYSSMKKISYRFIASGEQLDEADGNGGRVFIIRYPFTEEFDYETLLDNCSIVKTYDTEYRGWTAEALEIEIEDQNQS